MAKEVEQEMNSVPAKGEKKKKKSDSRSKSNNKSKGKSKNKSRSKATCRRLKDMIMNRGYPSHPKQTIIPSTKQMNNSLKMPYRFSMK